MKTIIAFLIFLASMSSAGAQGWYRQNSGTQLNLTRIFMFGKDSGYVAEDKVFRTTNGGTTWEFVPMPDGFKIASIIDFKTWFATKGPLVYHSYDGGMTWSDSSDTRLGVDIFPFYAIDKDTLLAFGQGNLHWSRSTDGGKTWWFSPDAAQINGVGPNKYDVIFLNKKKGYATGEIGLCQTTPSFIRSGVAATNDGGKTWRAVCTNKTRSPINELHGIYSQGNFIIAVGYYNTIILSKDGGQTWDSIPRTLMDRIYWGVFFTTNLHGYIVGSKGTILKTNDGGLHWEEQNSTLRIGKDTVVDFFLNRVKFLDTLTGWVVGDRGIVLHTTNGGMSWVRQQITIDTLNPQIYPVPSVRSATLGFTLSTAQHISISIVGELGNTIVQIIRNVFYDPGIHYEPLDLSSLPAGAYWCRIQSELYDVVVKGMKIVP